MSGEHEESFSNMNWPPLYPDFILLKVFGDVLEPRNGLTLDGNKCCDIA